MKEFACTCPNCNGRREIRRNKIVCPYCDSEWILVDNEPVKEPVTETYSTPINIRPMLNEKEEKDNDDEVILSLLQTWQATGILAGIILFISIFTGFGTRGIALLIINLILRVVVHFCIKKYK